MFIPANKYIAFEKSLNFCKNKTKDCVFYNLHFYIHRQAVCCEFSVPTMNNTIIKINSQPMLN